MPETPLTAHRTLHEVKLRITSSNVHEEEKFHENLSFTNLTKGSRQSKWKQKLFSHFGLFMTAWTIQSMDSLGQNTGVGSLSLLQMIFPTQGSNPGLPHCRWILDQLSYQGSPGIQKNTQIMEQFSKKEGMMSKSQNKNGQAKGWYETSRNRFLKTS